MNIQGKSSTLIMTFVLLASGGCAVDAGVDSTAAASMKGAASQMPAFYEDQQVTVNMKEMPDNASEALIEHNGSINQIYASNDLDEPQLFKPVIDAIQGEGFNPLWQQNLYSFNSGFTPRQFTAADDVLAAAEAGEITLTPTDEVYRCSVVGSKAGIIR